VFLVGRELVQEQYSWIEKSAGEEVRRFEVDLATGKAVAAVRGDDGEVDLEQAQLDLPHGRSFAGYGIVLAASELELEPGGTAELTFVAFTSKPRAVTLLVRRDGEEHIPGPGRSVPCDRYTLHPEIPFPLNLFAGVKDAHLWLTRAPRPELVRADGVPDDQGRPGPGHRRDAPRASAPGRLAAEARDHAPIGAVPQ
jgi:hypothetical protein